MEQNWNSVRSSKANPEAKISCPKCGKNVTVHPNYVKGNIFPCLPKCNSMEDVAKRMVEFRGWTFIKLEKEKIVTEKSITTKNIINFKKYNNDHICQLKYETLRKGGECKICLNSKTKISELKIDKPKKICDCKGKICKHYNHKICCPNSAKEWAYDLNNGKNPEDYAPQSNKGVWWICSNDWCKMEYKQIISSRFQGQRCPYCAGKKVCQWNCLATTHPEIAKEWDYENNKEDTPETLNHGSNKEVWWICKNHSPDFTYLKTINTRITQKQGCPKCNDPRYGQIHGGHDYFVQEARNIHGDKYNYVEEYKGNDIKIQIYCSEKQDTGEIHGIFLQTPSKHKIGRGCPKCSKGYDQLVGGHDHFVREARKVHGDKYQYPEEYKGALIKIQIFCNIANENNEIHGIFLQTPAQHKKGIGCPKCSQYHAQRIGGHDYFIHEARKVHGDKYQYPEEYKGALIKIQIHCPVLDKNKETHGIFLQRPGDHKRGNGCPKCANENNMSKLAEILKQIILNIGYKLNENWIEEYMHPSLKYISSLKIDNVLLDIKLAIEIDGSQHFKSSGFDYHSNENLIIRMARDIYKDKFCLENGFSLIRIPYNNKKPSDCIKYAIDLCRKGVRIYFTYQHYYNEIIKMVNLDWTKIYVFSVQCPKLRFKKRIENSNLIGN